MIIQNIKKEVRVSKTGKPYLSVVLQFDEYKDTVGKMRWISGFGNKRTWAWEKGDDVAPDVSERNGFLNFTFDDTEENRLNPYDMPATIGFVIDLLDRQGLLTKPVSDSPQEARPVQVEPKGEEDEDEIDIPF